MSALIFGTIIIGFLILTLLAKTHPYFSLDLLISWKIQEINYGWFANLMRIVSSSGNLIAASIILFSSFSLFIFKRKIKEGVIILLSTTGSTFVSAVIKTLIARPRPDANLVILFGNFGKNDSFPSGHVLFAMGFYGFLLFLAFTKLKKGNLKKIIIGLLITIIILMGLSRIYLGAHWFSDVLGSYLLGTLWLYLMVYFYKHLLARSKD